MTKDPLFEDEIACQQKENNRKSKFKRPLSFYYQEKMLTIS